MAGAGFEIVPEDPRVFDTLAILASALEDMTPAMNAIGAAVQTHVDLSFRNEEDPYGQPWEPLSVVTLDRRRGDSAQILRDTGVLANSITYAADKGSVEIGTNIDYATTHQFGAVQGEFGSTANGAPIPWGDIPERPFIPLEGLPSDLEDEILDITTRFIDRALNRA